MKKILGLVVLLSGLLSGCALLAPYDGPDPAQPRITFELDKPDSANNPRFSVVPRELLFKRRGEKTITWSLDANSNLRFAAKDAIVIDGELKFPVLTLRPNEGVGERKRTAGSGAEQLDTGPQDQIVDCRVSEDRLTATCINKHSRAGRFQYSVRLTNGRNDFLLDPTVNNW